MDARGVGDGDFVRWEPYSDGRKVIVRRGTQLGKNGGPPLGRRTLTIGGAPIVLVTYQQLISPPPLRPGDSIMSPEAAAHYTPTSEVALLPGTELLLRRHPAGFSDAEVVEIVTAFAARNAP